MSSAGRPIGRAVKTLDRVYALYWMYPNVLNHNLRYWDPEYWLPFSSWSIRAMQRE